MESNMTSQGERFGLPVLDYKQALNTCSQEKNLRVVEAGGSGSWEDLLKIVPQCIRACNSMTLTDICLLPQSLEGERDFELTVFSIDRNYEKEKWEDALLQKIKEIRPELNVSLKVITHNEKVMKSDLHDRYVFTNSYVLEVGAGYSDLLMRNNNGKLHFSHTTKIECHNILSAGFVECQKLRAYAEVKLG